MNLTREDIEALMQKDDSMENLDAQLDAWGIDSEAFSDISAAWAAAAAPRMTGLPLDIALGVAWGGAFLIGYAARIEVEMRQKQADEDGAFLEPLLGEPTLCTCHFTGHRPGCPNA